MQYVMSEMTSVSYNVKIMLARRTVLYYSVVFVALKLIYLNEVEMK
jgi:hypothetical protein